MANLQTATSTMQVLWRQAPGGELIDLSRHHRPPLALSRLHTTPKRVLSRREGLLLGVFALVLHGAVIYWLNQKPAPVLPIVPPEVPPMTIEFSHPAPPVVEPPPPAPIPQPVIEPPPPVEDELAVKPPPPKPIPNPKPIVKPVPKPVAKPVEQPPTPPHHNLWPLPRHRHRPHRLHLHRTPRLRPTPVKPKRQPQVINIVTLLASPYENCNKTLHDGFQVSSNPLCFMYQY